MYYITGIVNAACLIFLLLKKRTDERFIKTIENRKIWMDILKIISAYMIVLLHISGSRFYGRYGADGFFTGLLLNSFVRFAVPCFLLVTGALTMEKHYSAAAAFQRMRKYLWLLLWAVFIYLLAKCILWQGFEENFLILYFKALLTNNLSGHLWYLYQLIWIWMLLPFVQRLYTKSSMRQRMYFVMATLLLPSAIDFLGRICMEDPAEFMASCSITIHPGYFGILVLGGVLNELIKKYSGLKAGMISVFLCIGSFVFLVITTAYECDLRGSASDEFFYELRLPALLYGCSVFIMFGTLYSGLKKFRKIRYAVAAVSDSLLYVYVGHCLLQWIWDIKQDSVRNLVIVAGWQFFTCVLVSCAGKKVQRIFCGSMKLSRMQKQRNRILTGFLMIFVLACMFCHTDSPWSRLLPFTDSDVFLYGGWAMHQGEVLYVDFFDHKGPYFYFLQWAGWGLTNSYVGVWMIEFIFVCVSVAASYALLRKLHHNRAVCIGALLIGYWYLSCYLSLGNYTEAYVMPMISISALIFFFYFTEERYELNIGQCIVLGVLFTTAFFIRPNSIAIWIIFCIVIVLHSFWLKRYRNIGRYLAGFLTGMIIASLPLIIYLTKESAWKGFIEFFLFNFKYVEASGSKWNAVGHFFITPVSVAAFSGIVLACIDKWKRKQPLLLSVCILGWYVLGMYFTCMAGAKWNHYGCMLLPVYPIGIMELANVIKSSISDVRTKKAAFAVGALRFCFVIFIAVNLYDPIGNLQFIRNNTRITVDSPSNDMEVKVLSERIREKTGETERISVFGNACKYYLAAQRLSASKWIYQNPLYHINHEIGESYVADLLKNKPSAVIVQDKSVFSDEEDETAEKVKAFLNKSYICDYNGGSVQLYFLKEQQIQGRTE